MPRRLPDHVFEVSEVLKQLGPDSAGLRALFGPSIRSATRRRFEDYLSSFDPNLGGGHWKPRGDRRALKAYRVYSRKVPTEGVTTPWTIRRSFI